MLKLHPQKCHIFLKTFTSFSRAYVLSNSSTYPLNILLTNYVKTSQLPEAIAVFSELKILGQPDAISYTTLMKGYCKANQIKEAEDLFHEMQSRNLVPPRSAYHILIDCYANNKDNLKVEGLLKIMKKSRIELDARNYASIIKLFCNMDAVYTSLQYLQEMKLKGIQAESVSYNIIIKKLAQKKDFEKATSLLLEMIQHGIQPTTFTYGAIIRGYALVGNVFEVEKLVRDMKNQNISVDHYIFGFVIMSHIVRGDYSTALELIKQLEADYNDKNAVAISYFLLIQYMCKKGLFTEPFQLYKSLIEKNVLLPNIKTFSHLLMGVICRKKANKKIEQILTEMRKFNIQPDDYFSSLIDRHKAKLRERIDKIK